MNDVLIDMDLCPFKRADRAKWFDKKGRTTTKYECLGCGLIGVRDGESPVLVAQESCRKAVCGPPTVQITTDEFLRGRFGLKTGMVYAVVPCPPDQRDRYPGSVWVDSPTRYAPVRLLTHEFRYVTESIANPVTPV